MTLHEKLEQNIRTVPDFPSPGIQFKDITPVMAVPGFLPELADALVLPFADRGITKVIGIESRGFVLGGMMAERLGAGFVPVRKKGKLPSDTHEVSYDLEYGSATVEMHIDAVEPEELVLIHDDLIATGGTAAAAAQLVRQAGGLLVGYSFLIELAFLEGRRVLDHPEIHTLLTY